MHVPSFRSFGQEMDQISAVKVLLARWAALWGSQHHTGLSTSALHSWPAPLICPIPLTGGVTYLRDLSG